MFHHIAGSYFKFDPMQKDLLPISSDKFAQSKSHNKTVSIMEIKVLFRKSTLFDLKAGIKSDYYKDWKQLFWHCKPQEPKEGGVMHFLKMEAEVWWTKQSKVLDNSTSWFSDTSDMSEWLPLCTYIISS